MKILTNLLLISTMFLFGSCASLSPSDEKAKEAAQWVQERSGFIEAAVASVTQVAVYSTVKDSDERKDILGAIHLASSNLNALVDNKIVDADSIRAALKIKEEYFNTIFSAVMNLAQAEIKNFRNNGYGDFTLEVLTAVSKGLNDGSAE